MPKQKLAYFASVEFLKEQYAVGWKKKADYVRV
jgi:hypothetical protein